MAPAGRAASSGDGAADASGRPRFLDARGSRLKLQPEDVEGRFVRWRRIVYGILVVHLLALPFIENGQHPAIHLDIPGRRFFLAGQAFNAQDTWLLVFLLAGFAFGLLFVTAVAGRLWCGWACPQTVFLEGIYRPIERLIEGPAAQRRRLREGGWTARRVLLFLVKQGIYLVVSLVLAHWFLAFFVTAPVLATMVLGGPAGHETLFVVAMAVTAAFMFDFAWFREQLCVVMCPYGRLQSVLTDRQTLVVGYDVRRGEPRGKVTKETGGAVARGDCVDCGRCVRVCPTGIDIRNGSQMECIGCSQCIDACDAIMAKVHRPAGLIRYDSLEGFEGGRRKLLRPRILAYGAVSAGLVLAAALDVFALRTPFEANLLRSAGLPYVLTDGGVRNQFEVHLVNKHVDAADFELSVEAPASAHVILPQPRIRLGSLQGIRTPLLVSTDRVGWTGPFDVRVTVRDVGSGTVRRVQARVLGPPAGAVPAG